MKNIIFVICSLLLSANSFAHLGNGSSGGGNIYGNQLNPWFIQNTKNVSYCVEIAPEFGSVSEERVFELIAESFDYWKGVFKKHNLGMAYPKFRIEVGTQNFIKSEKCSPEVDVHFQFGFLTENQKLDFPNLNQVLGLAQRTSYDEVNLRGKGFIYIAPEKGPLRPLGAQLHSKPWSSKSNIALKYALLHEMGHIFGLQDDHYSNVSLMGARWLEHRTTTEAINQIDEKDQKEIASSLGCNDEYEGSTDFYFMTGAYDRAETHWLKVLSSKGLIKFILDNVKYGEIRLKTNSDGDEEVIPAISFYFTKSQNVFSGLGEFYINRSNPVIFLRRSVFLKDEVLKLANGEELKVFITFDQNCAPKVGAIRDGKIILDIIMFNR